jgi:hypothetical protein
MQEKPSNGENAKDMLQITSKKTIPESLERQT